MEREEIEEDGEIIWKREMETRGMEGEEIVIGGGRRWKGVGKMGVGKGRNGGELAKEDIRQKETEDKGGIGEKGGGKVESIEGSGTGR